MASKGKFLAPVEEESTLSAPTMNRSRSQLGAAYAPGAFFTFEGGLGSCISIPDLSANVDDAPIDETIKAQIMLRLQEVWQSWFAKAFALNAPTRTIDPRQCIDSALLNRNAVVPLSGDRIAFLSPLRMGYAPTPLTFVCNRCRLFKSFTSAPDLNKRIDELRECKCTELQSKGPCQWRQLDVVFVHWSGDWMPVTPGRWEWSDKKGEAWLSGEECRVCRGKSFRLHTASPRIGQWHFSCASCGYRGGDEWRQNDRFTTEIFRDQAAKRPVGERRMEPISYRASSTFYPQSEQFILFPKTDQQLLVLLEPQRILDLEEFIAGKFRFGAGALTPAEMKVALLAAGRSDEWESYENLERMRAFAEASKDTTVIQVMEKELTKLVQRWTTGEPPLLHRKVELPECVRTQIRNRDEFTSKYDPFLLAVEHEALNRGKLSVPSSGARSQFVRFNHLDNDLAPKNPAAKVAQEAETHRLMGKLGAIDLGLIREFDLCRFTHGYTRMSAVPTMAKHNLDMPVRLRLFEPLLNGKRPVYVITQANEAIYARLDPKAVYGWLKQVGVLDLPKWESTDAVLFGGRILEAALPFGRYFSQLKEGDAATYRYVYTLLHTYAHTLMKNVAELSGLDLGSMSEYLFPADLAFVVYRNGTTMDLGNLSSLWRNENNRFLSRLLEPSTHRCNSGRLCDSAGGACPDCIMVPETSCVAQNQLLSRAVLRGGPAPREDLTHQRKRIRGFLEFVNEGPET